MIISNKSYFPLFNKLTAHTCIHVNVRYVLTNINCKIEIGNNKSYAAKTVMQCSAFSFGLKLKKGVASSNVDDDYDDDNHNDDDDDVVVTIQFHTCDNKTTSTRNVSFL